MIEELASQYEARVWSGEIRISDLSSGMELEAVIREAARSMDAGVTRAAIAEFIRAVSCRAAIDQLIHEGKLAWTTTVTPIAAGSSMAPPTSSSPTPAT